MKKKYRYITIYSILLNLIFIFFIIIKICKLDYRPAVPSNWYTISRQSLFEKLHLDTNSIVFAGASLIDHGEWNELLKNSRIVNRGISGDKIADLQSRIDCIIKFHPSKIFIMIGLNDILSNKSIHIISATLCFLIDKIHSQSPQTSIYLNSLLPVNRPAVVNDKINFEIIKLNKLYQTISQEKNCYYIDLYANFKDENGNLKAGLTEDGIHLNADGYYLWAQQLLPLTNTP